MPTNEDINKYINEPEIELYNTYFMEEQKYLLTKYKDTYLWLVYEYYLFNRNLPVFYKSIDTILEELYNCMAKPKFLECKKILIEEGILEVIKDDKGLIKHYKFHRIKTIIQPVINSYNTSNQNLLPPVRNNYYPKNEQIENSKPKESIFLEPNINKFNKDKCNNNKVCDNNIYGNIEKDYSLPHSHEEVHTQKEYLDSIKQNNTKLYNAEELESQKLLEQIQLLFKEHAPHRLQELTALQINPNITTAKLTQINKKLKDTNSNYIDFFKWLGGDKPRQFVIVAGIYKILDSIDKQVNFYLQDKVNIEKAEKEKRKYSLPPAKPITDAEVNEMVRKLKEEERKNKELEHATT